MKKYSRGIIGVFILFIVAVVAFCSYNILSSRQSANVSKNENLAKTTDGATCNNDEEMNSEYEPKVSFSQGKATITVNWKVLEKAARRSRLQSFPNWTAGS